MTPPISISKITSKPRGVEKEASGMQRGEREGGSLIYQGSYPRLQCLSDQTDTQRIQKEQQNQMRWISSDGIAARIWSCYHDNPETVIELQSLVRGPLRFAETLTATGDEMNYANIQGVFTLKTNSNSFTPLVWTICSGGDTNQWSMVRSKPANIDLL